MKRLWPATLALFALALAACAPSTTTVVFDPGSVVCVNDPMPVVAVIEFDNTTSRFGVNVTGVESDASQGRYASAKIVWTLLAPDKPGDYPLVGVYLYGTEKGTPLGTKTHPVYGKTPLGGFGGNSGRVKITPAEIITVK